MSSVYHGSAIAIRGNDGIIWPSHPEHAYIVATNYEANPWWQVDLLENYLIYASKFYNRLQCCKPFTSRSGCAC